MRRPVPKTLAVVDLGSNAVRLQVASAQPDGTLEVRAEDRAAVRLGAQVFRTGRLSSESISGCAGALVRFAKLAQTAGATHVRAVATSAVREASNRDELLRAARSRAGIDIEVISGAEEARLVCLGVFQGTSASDRSLLIDIGGGSTEIISAHGEEPEHAFSLQLGSVRLSEFFVEHDPISRREAQLIEEAVEDAVLQIDPVLIGKHRRIIGAAGTTGAVAALAQSMSGTPGGSRPVSHAEVRAVLDKLRSADLKKRKKLGVDPSRIDVIYAGTAILEGVMRKLRVEEMQVTTRGLRDGLMADLVRREVRPPAAGLHEENAVLEGLRAFGRRCGYREPHAEQVAQLSLALFDQLRPMHRLGAEERGLLHAAALLHDVGTFVSYNRHHKHGYYLLFYADLPGFTDRERELIATIARYHRRSVPKDRHEVFQLLTPAERVVVRGLAAILRVADGLDRGHRRQVRRLEVSRRAPGMRIDVWAEKGADLEVWSAQQKSDLLAEVCGGPVRFRLHVVPSRR
ncbi:MAG: Ppx/GppA family phosphatase [Deltaproteobacteria bacterium]|nr:MAG: Ppx/GppA family phosphatase [Deltaproteobacteria bacterium]